ncbi:MAG: DUF3293 domain-containing protein [Pseudoxanthomonas sp.]
MRRNGDDAPMNGGENRESPMAALATAYALAHYFVTIGHREWLFGVGQDAADIERELGARHYLFITAWNPPSTASSLAENVAADERLQARLKEVGFQSHSALGCNAQGGAVEYGWMVLDVPVESGDALAREFGQAGTLYWQRGQPVRLRMLSPQPAGIAEQPHIDWAG